MADTPTRVSGDDLPPHNDFNGPHETSSRPSSRNMMISPNLVAALEYDEQTRAPFECPSSPSLPLFATQESPAASTTGLPPPPRPKSSASKTRPPPMSPATPLVGLVDPPRTPPYPSAKHAASQSNPYINPLPPPTTPLIGLVDTSRTPPTPFVKHAASQSNPYINPPPRLTHLQLDSGGLARMHSRTPSLPDRFASRSPESTRTGESPQGSRESSPVLVSSPESAKSAGEGRSSFQRHMRVFSGLPRVERMLGKGKGRSGAKSVDEKRRESVGAGEEGRAAGGRETAGPMMRQFFKSLERHRAAAGDDGSRSAPVSPVMGSESGERPGGRPGPEGGGWPKREGDCRRPSTARWSRSSASETSHEPPSTPDEPRISISSTVYQASRSSIHYSPLYNHNDPLYPRSDMHSDTESFMDLASPTFSPRLQDFTSNAFSLPSSDSQPYPTDTANSPPDTSPRPSVHSITTSGIAKPPLPTTPKPHFNKRSKSAQPHLNKTPTPGDSPVVQEVPYPADLPPTTNFLNPLERAGRVRTARKLAQLLGQTPPAMESLALSQQAFQANPPAGGFLAASNNIMSNFSSKKKQQLHQRGAVSMSVTPVEQDPLARAAVPDAARDAAALASRRHSSPLSPQTFSFVDIAGSEESRSSDVDSSVVIEIGSQQGEPYSDWSSHAGHDGGGLMSPTSFMDLSEEDMAADGASSLISAETPTVDRPHLLSSGASIRSFTSEEFVEEERRRKREKLAKLHRFLGSRVPLDIVLNQVSLDVAKDLPPVISVSAVDPPTSKMDPDTRKVWLRRRRSSSAAELGGKWSDEIDRLKEELNEREKALNVRRAVKMEKLFGVQPPQTLYHTRSAPSHAEAQMAAVTKQATSPSSPVDPSRRNVNQTAYSRAKARKGSGNRPGTAESSKPLLDPSNSGGHAFSDVYEHYRHSLNSLNDIMDRDDTASLKRLHSIIHGELSEAEEEPALQEFVRHEADASEDANADGSATPRRERRRSLPSRASMTSISSEYSVVLPTAEELDFQARRKRAAKLTQFFGVHYRDLMSEILDSIEKGLEEEGGRGTLRPDEVQELLTKLRKLKNKRNSSFTLTTPK